MKMPKEELLYENESYQILGAVYAVYKELGTGFLENVYQEALEEEFNMRNIPFERQKQLKIQYRNVTLKKTYIADLVCYDKIILEIKAVDCISTPHLAQLYNYLKATQYRLGYVINFGSYPKAEIKVSRNERG